MKNYNVRVNEQMVYNIKARDEQEAVRKAMDMHDADFGQSISYICEIL
jgi:hypothetical protein